MTDMNFDHIDHVMRALLANAVGNGIERGPRGMQSIEIGPMGFRLTNPRARLTNVRNIRKPYSAASVAWNLGKRSDVESICFFNPNGRMISDDGMTFHGANYGWRMMDSIWHAIQLLVHDRDTRRAWVQIWDPRTEYGENTYVDGDETNMYSIDGKDVPCTIGFLLKIRTNYAGSDVLDMHVVMRSQSVWGVMPYDVFLFTVLQELIANELGVELGEYMHEMLSCHVYGRELEQIKEALFDPKPTIAPMNRLDMNLLTASRDLPEVMMHVVHDEDIGRGAENELEEMLIDGYELHKGERVHG